MRLKRDEELKKHRALGSKWVAALGFLWGWSDKSQAVQDAHRRWGHRDNNEMLIQDGEIKIAFEISAVMSICHEKE